MNVQDLIIFQEVARSGSINQAATAMNYSQSNVTSRIKKLEHDLHVTLFYRHQKGVTLTNEGKELLPYAQKIISLTDQMKMLASDTKRVTGTLDIASVETVIGLPTILSAYIKAYDSVDVTLSTGVTSELRDKVLNFELDGAFVTKGSMTNDPKLQEVPVFDERLVLLSNAPNATVEDVLEQPILRFSEGCMYREKLNDYLEATGRKPKRAMELGTLETTLISVISGLGVAYLPYEAVTEYIEKGSLYATEIPEAYSQISTVFIYRKEDYVTPALKKFIQTIEDVRERTMYKNEKKEGIEEKK
ncbi:LysR family transcriptional regulator [Planococcaceae bacterium Storch 2/2-2]|nr:LysR family transcriptional regulator [Planococcaceae bacterium Storch 2/2-2]